MDEKTTFSSFKHLCETEGLLPSEMKVVGDNIWSGVYDDGTLLRFLRARDFNVKAAFEQYRTTRKWRDDNQLLELYDSINVSDYEATRKLYTHWTGRRDRNGSPLLLFEIQQLTPHVMAAYNEACSSSLQHPGSTESEALLRLFCTYENLVRFVQPLCSAVQSRPEPQSPVTDTTCIVDVSGVTLLQFWRLRSHLQAASTLATSHYPETLGKTYVIGAPSFFPTIWTWLSKWFSQHTVSKICIVPPGQELAILSKVIDPVNIPQKYGGQFPFEFGMLPDLDDELTNMVKWSKDGEEGYTQEMPIGPIKWVQHGEGAKEAVAVGTVDGTQRNSMVMTLP